MRAANLLVLMSDEHNPKFLGAAGHPFVATPNLDALAAQGTRFASAYTLAGSGPCSSTPTLCWRCAGLIVPTMFVCRSGCVKLKRRMNSIGVMPPALQAVTFLVPARYFLVVTRGIFLKGVGAEVLYPQGLLMILFAAIGVVLATRIFKKEL